jgi:FKBP-type peptidyl-prolyl cis-trans isomerase FkpA
VHYEGALINGDVFDSTYPSGQPIDFPLEVVIPGWREGVLLMTEGSTYRFVIPQELGYGKNAVRSIPAGSTLVFKVELISIIQQEM